MKQVLWEFSDHDFEIRFSGTEFSENDFLNKPFFGSHEMHFESTF